MNNKTVTFDASQYQLVPKVPTEEILSAIFCNERDAKRAWNEALAAAFAPAAQSALPEGWRIVEKKTCFVIQHGNEVVASLAGPEAEENAAIIARALSRAQSAGQEAVGVAGTMPGTDGFTMACFKADEVPVGTKLYATPVNGGERCHAIDCAVHNMPAYPNGPCDCEISKDAERYRWLRDTLHGAKAGGGVEVNNALQVYEEPTPGEEVRIYWYQDTPVGFYEVHGSTLCEAIDRAIAIENDHDE